MLCYVMVEINLPAQEVIQTYGWVVGGRGGG